MKTIYFQQKLKIKFLYDDYIFMYYLSQQGRISEKVKRGDGKDFLRNQFRVWIATKL